MQTNTGQALFSETFDLDFWVIILSHLCFCHYCYRINGA